MRAATRSALTAVLLILLAGCSHSPKQPPAQAQAPSLATVGNKLPPPNSPEEKKADIPPPSPLPQPSAQTTPPALPALPPKRVRRQRSKPAKPAENSETASNSKSPETASSPPASNEQAQSDLPSSASPIGELTTGDSATGGQTKSESAALIAQTKRGLDSIKRPLSKEEKATAAQIRTFLRQAETALNSGDADGAHTLATKASLLLDELLKK